MLVLPPARCAATPQKSDPSLNNQTCSLRAKPAWCDFASLALRISQHRSARSKRTPWYRLCTIFGAPDPLGIMPQGIRTGIGPLRKEARPFGPALCQCSATPQRSRPKPPQTDMFAPSHASLQSNCQPRALHMTRIASRTARACLGTVSAPFVWCFRPAWNYAPGQAYWNEDGIISGQDSPICRVAEGPRTPC